MRAAVYHGRRDVRVEDMADPGDPTGDHVIVGVTRASVCGTDLHEFLHGPRMIPLRHRHPISGHVGPMTIGHEFTGQIVARGPGAELLDLGDRVAVGAGHWCGRCRWCLEGRVNLCREYFVYGLHAPGGLAELVAVPAGMCHRVPGDCSDDAASLTQPLAIALHALDRSGVRAESTVVVIGTGGIGSLIIGAAAARAARALIAVDVDTGRLAAAQQLGATACVEAAGDGAAEAVRGHTDGDGAEIVIEASGTRAGLELAVGAVRRGGRIHLVGLQGETSQLDLRRFVLDEVSLSSSNGHVCGADLPNALALLARGDLARSVIDRQIGLDELVENGLETMAEGRTHGKVIVAVGRG